MGPIVARGVPIHDQEEEEEEEKVQAGIETYKDVDDN